MTQQLGLGKPRFDIELLGRPGIDWGLRKPQGRGRLRV